MAGLDDASALSSFPRGLTAEHPWACQGRDVPYRALRGVKPLAPNPSKGKTRESRTLRGILLAETRGQLDSRVGVVFINRLDLVNTLFGNS